jgi:large repetitive protein
VLIAGGAGDSGALATVELYGPDGISVAAPLLEPRANPACAALNDGRVLVTGGSRDDQPLRSAEVYNPGTGSWSNAGNMSVARSGHTAALTPSGTVVLIGGENSGTIEAFLNNGTFTSIGVLSTPRTAYALAVLPDHRILIAGGVRSEVSIGTVEIYNAADNTILPVPDLLSPRANASAAALYDGTVLVSGGYGADGKPLSTTEIYDPRNGMSVVGPMLRQPRAGHTSYTLPNNGQVLIVGGTDGQNSLATTEIYTPWTARIIRTGGMHSQRSSMSLSPFQPGRVVVAGGKNGSRYLAGSEVYSFATVESDRSDYLPGETTNLMGRGWRPGETVSLNVTAFPLDERRMELTGTAQADGNGRVLFKGFSIDPSHPGIRFLAMATGSESQAQTVFATGNPTALVTPPFAITTSPVNPTALSTFTVTITLSPVGGIVPTGQVQLLINAGNPSDPVSLVNGSATIPVPSSVSLNVGTVNIGFLYLGDSNYLPIVPGVPGNPIQVTIGKTSTTSSVTSTPTSPITYGTAVTFNGTVSSAGAANGTANLTDSAGAWPGGGNTGLTVTNGAVSHTPSALFSAGTHGITLAYLGSASFNTSTSPVYSLQVLPATPTVTLTSTSVTGLTLTGSVTFTATLTSPGSAGPAPGTVSFSDGAQTIAGCTSVPVTGSGPVTATCTVVYDASILVKAAGSHSVTATYTPSGTGSSNFATATSSPLTFTVAKLSPVVAVSSNLNPSVYGQTVTFTATVTTPSGLPLPIGGLQFADGGVAIGSVLSIAGTGANSVTYQLSIPSGSLPVLGRATHAISATYMPLTDPNFLLVSSASQTVPSLVSQVVNKTTPSVFLTSTTGTQAQLSVTLSGPVAQAAFPSGTVTFSEGSTTLGTATLSGAGNQSTASITANLIAGTHSLSVSYAGDTNYDGTSSTISATLRSTSTSRIPTITNLTSSATTANPGQQVTFTATVVSALDSGKPTGTVEFLNTTTGTLLGTAVLTTSSGSIPTASITTASLPSGVSAIVARYLGDGSYNDSESARLLMNGQRFEVALSIVNTPSSSQFGAPVTFAITVAAVNASNGTPTGQVELFDGFLSLGVFPLTSGKYSFITSTLAKGSHTIKVTYSGDSTFSAAGPKFVTQLVDVAATTTTLSSTPDGLAKTTLVATVKPVASGPGTPTGTVQFTDQASGQAIGSATLTANSGVLTATLSITGLTLPGTHTFIAEYQGDSAFGASKSNPQGQFGTQIVPVNGASFVPGFAPDQWVTIFGDDLAASASVATTFPDSTTLAGVSVQVVDAQGASTAAPIYFVSAHQINLVLPAKIAPGLATIKVTRSDASSASAGVTVTSVAPGLFSANASGQGIAAALVQRVHFDGSQAIEGAATYDAGTKSMIPAPITVNSDAIYLQLYGTGIRNVTSTAQVSCTIGAKLVPALFAGPAPGFYSLDQVNVKVPDGMAGAGSVNVMCTIAGQQSNTVTLTFK